MKQYIIRAFAVVIAIWGGICASSADIIARHQPILTSFAQLDTSKKHDKEAFLGFFKKVDAASGHYVKELFTDIRLVKKSFKGKSKKQLKSDPEHALVMDLEKMYKFLQKYRLQLEVVAFHNFLRSELQDLFNIVDQSGDILPVLPQKGFVKPGVKGLKSFIKQMDRYLAKINEYEDRVHADWIDLKLANYILKIELIRLRNAAIFHPQYRGTPINTNYPR